MAFAALCILLISVASAFDRTFDAVASSISKVSDAFRKDMDDAFGTVGAFSGDVFSTIVNSDFGIGLQKWFGPCPDVCHSVSLLSAHQKYLSAQSDGTVRCDRTSVGSWEKFELEIKYGVKFPTGTFIEGCLKSSHGYYLSISPYGDIEWNRVACAEWETLYMWLRFGRVSIFGHSAKSLSAQPDGSVQLRDIPLAWETFIINNCDGCF